jgi:hypothetical protein
MTLPDERYRAVKNTYEFLRDIATRKYARVPKEVREQAVWCLRHYPSEWDLQRAADAAPDVFQERMEPVTRLFKKYEQGMKKE